MAVAETQLTETQRQLWQMISASHNRTLAAIEKALQEAELPPLAWFDVMQPISVSPNEMLRPRDLGCGVRISRSGLTRLLDRMEGAGVIVRRRCDEDRRGSYIGLTESGAKTIASMREVVETELATIFAELYNEEEASQLVALLTRAATC